MSKLKTIEVNIIPRRCLINQIIPNQSLNNCSTDDYSAHLDAGHQRQGQREDDEDGGDPRENDGTRSRAGGVGWNIKKTIIFYQIFCHHSLPDPSSYTANL